MAVHADREHFIPLRVTDLIEFLCEEKGVCGTNPLTPEEQREFRRFARMIQNHFHMEYHERLQQLKDAYAPFDPDADTVPLSEPPEEQRGPLQHRLFADIRSLLERANYRLIAREEFDRVTQGRSDWGLEMTVDWDVFDQIEIYYRGDMPATRTRRKWYKLWRREEVKVPSFARLVVVIKQKPHRRLGRDADTRNVFLKQFKEIPKVDLEMVLPGTRVCWTKFDQALVIYPVVTGLGIFLYKILSSVIGFRDLIAGAIGAVASWSFVILLGGYGYRSYYSYTVKKTNYTLQLTKSLYYQNLDSNAGVLYRLLDEAEEQECREAILAYFFLWRYAGAQGWAPEALDDYVEIELERRLNMKVDFEIDDALHKLERMGIAERVNGRYRVPPIDRAVEALARAHQREFRELREGEQPAVPELV